LPRGCAKKKKKKNYSCGQAKPSRFIIHLWRWSHVSELDGNALNIKEWTQFIDLHERNSFENKSGQKYWPPLKKSLKSQKNSILHSFQRIDFNPKIVKNSNQPSRHKKISNMTRGRRGETSLGSETLLQISFQQSQRLQIKMQMVPFDDSNVEDDHAQQGLKGIVW
jgi:hypothetical protein